LGSDGIHWLKTSDGWIPEERISSGTVEITAEPLALHENDIQRMSSDAKKLFSQNGDVTYEGKFENDHCPSSKVILAGKKLERMEHQIRELQLSVQDCRSIIEDLISGKELS
jgi:hypothetical protein